MELLLFRVPPGSRQSCWRRAEPNCSGTPREPTQIALAWLLRRSPNMLPIPGTSSIEHLEQNVAAASLRLAEEEYESFLGFPSSWDHGDAVSPNAATVSCLGKVTEPLVSLKEGVGSRCNKELSYPLRTGWRRRSSGTCKKRPKPNFILAEKAG